MSRPTPVPRPARLYYVPTSHQQSHPRYIYTPAAQHEGGGGGGAVLRLIYRRRAARRTTDAAGQGITSTWDPTSVPFLPSYTPVPFHLHLPVIPALPCRT